MKNILLIFLVFFVTNLASAYIYIPEYYINGLHDYECENDNYRVRIFVSTYGTGSWARAVRMEVQNKKTKTSQIEEARVNLGYSSKAKTWGIYLLIDTGTYIKSNGEKISQSMVLFQTPLNKQEALLHLADSEAAPVELMSCGSGSAPYFRTYSTFFPCTDGEHRISKQNNLDICLKRK